jgi:hypothetical protein
MDKVTIRRCAPFLGTATNAATVVIMTLMMVSLASPLSITSAQAQEDNSRPSIIRPNPDDNIPVADILDDLRDCRNDLEAGGWLGDFITCTNLAWDALD